MKSAVVVAALLAPSIAAAQPGAVDPEAPSRAVPAPVDTVDENVAVGLSLGGTAVSWGLLILAAQTNGERAETMGTIGAIGTLLAPSLGHWYSHKILTRGLGIRALGVGVGMVGLAMAIGNWSSDSESSNNDDGTIGALLVIAAGMYIAGTVDDIAMASSSARRYNSRFDNVMLVPQISQNGGGVAVLGRF